MKLIDYFAAHALQGLIVNSETVSVHVPITARAYELAVAMINRRAELLGVSVDLDETAEG